MNQRIRELAEQATSNILVNHEGYRGKGYTEQVEYFNKEKFAELIVAECVKLLPPEMTHGPDGRPLEQVFKQHFGVEQ